MVLPGEHQDTERVEHIYAQPVKIELERLASGKYKWTISLHAEDSMEALKELSAIDQALRTQYVEEV